MDAVASGKKTDDEHESLVVGPIASHSDDRDAARVDDVPDRLLILANRLQRALDNRRAVGPANGRRKN
ncbi:hypothetical protein ACIQUG_21705 [Ensifer sp. NPDC090286]|uniref:hypothetical protein n=1 Tax=Ensifer sp. NPDC090286 TaxID=3363991 RepID=UPI00383B3FC8